MTTEQITEALDWMERYDPSLNTTPIHPLSVVVGAARDHLTCLGDWVTCSTCHGSGLRRNLDRPDEDDYKPCPDCVDGLTPSPELIERAAQPVAANDGIKVLDWHRDLAKAVLLASR